MSQEVERPAKSRKILVIDDDPQGIDVILEPLKWEGYDAVGVDTLEEGIRVIDSWMPAIIVVDFKEQKSDELLLFYNTTHYILQ